MSELRASLVAAGLSTVLVAAGALVVAVIAAVQRRR